MTVLIVEDEASLRDLVAVAVRILGYQTVTAATVVEAESVRVQRGLASLALVITDGHLTTDLGAWEGYALWERWRAIQPDLPFLLLSGDPAATRLWGIRTGAVRWLAKPFDLAELQTIVRELLGA